MIFGRFANKYFKLHRSTYRMYLDVHRTLILNEYA